LVASDFASFCASAIRALVSATAMVIDRVLKKFVGCCSAGYTQVAKWSGDRVAAMSLFGGAS
jgi:hypothetical protein